MFKKYSILVWVVLLLILVGIYIAVEYTSSADRTFRQKVVTFNVDEITAVRINNIPAGILVDLKQEQDTWNIYEDGKLYNGEPRAVSQILELLNSMSTESIVATRQDKWTEYKLDEEQAIVVELFAGDDLVETIYVGKFDYKQIPSQDPQQKPQTKMTSYVRTEYDEMVYAVDGILRLNIQDGKSPFRDPSLFNCNDAGDITKLTISGTDEELILDMTTPEWNLNGLAVDSTRTARFLNKLSRTNSSAFIDTVDVEPMSPAYTILIEGKTFAPVSLKAYPADTITGHYITSSQNPGSVFDGSRSRLFESTFVGREKFLGD